VKPKEIPGAMPKAKKKPGGKKLLPGEKVRHANR
jgi:hypothetical protein